MAREIYNKNARAKVLLEQAYTSIYNEEISGDFKLSGQFHPSMEQGIRKHIMNLVNYVTDNNIKVVSYMDGPTLNALGDAMEKVAPTMISWFRTEYGLSNLARDVISAMGNVEDYESEEGGAINGNEIELTNDPSAQQVQKKAIPLQFRIAEQPETVQTLEGAVEAPAGAYIMTGTKGENWPIPADKFKETYDIIDKQHAAKKPIPVPAKQMDQNFFVTVSWSPDKLQGEPGDWLVQYGPGDYGVVEAGIFDETYDLL